MATMPSASSLHCNQPNSSIVFTKPSMNAIIRSKPFSVSGLSSSGIETLKVEASSSNARKVVILPGLGNSSSDYIELSRDLQKFGLSSVTAQVSRPDWLRNAAGLTDLNYWRGTLKPRPILDWYLERVKEAIHLAKSDSSAETVSIIGHSAGGWLARLFLSEFGTEDVNLLLTLGTPHIPPPKGLSGVIDQTRGLLDAIQESSPGAFHSDVRYVCVAGRYLRGARFVDNGVNADVANSAPVSNGFQAKIVGQGYKQVCGQSDVWGDGVVPEQSAHLEGAINVSLDGVYHSPVGAGPQRPWFGSPGVIDKWVGFLLE